MKAALTPWFPADVKPVRVGMYERDWRGGFSAMQRRDYWNGIEWLFSGDGLTASSLPSASNMRWRGLASDPSVSP